MGSQRGESGIGLILFLVIAAAGIYVALIHASPYIRNYQLGKTVAQAARNATDTSPNRRHDLTIFLTRKIADMKFPLKLEDFKVEYENYDVKISVEWEHEVVIIPENRFVPPYSRHLYFYHEAIEPIKQ
jgi:hypothetical protein